MTIERISVNGTEILYSADEVINCLNDKKSEILSLVKSKEIIVHFGSIPTTRCLLLKAYGMQFLCVDTGIINYAGDRLDWLKEVGENIAQENQVPLQSVKAVF